MPEVLFDGASLRAIGTNLHRDRILVTFDRHRKNRPFFTNYTSVNTAQKFDMGHLSILTSQNDWFLNGETQALREVLRRFSVQKTTYAIGFSMGGYGALLFSPDLRLKHAFLLAPQYSVFPDKAPYEPRYLNESSVLNPEQDNLVAPKGNTLSGIITYDPRLQPIDHQHSKNIIQRFSGLKPVALPFGGHPPLQLFKDGKSYAKMMRAFLKGRLSPKKIRKMHSEARVSSECYWKHLNHYQDLRKKR